MSDSEFQWRRQMRDLGGPVQPQRDLWLDIAGRIAAEQAAAVQPVAPTRRRWALPFAAAASVMLVGLLATALWQSHRNSPDPAQLAAQTAQGEAVAALASTNRQFKQVRSQDPRLVAATVELDAAAEQIEQMLQQQPDAVFLVGLLNRTNERRLKLARMGLASS